MANVNRPFGMAPVRNSDGSTWNQAVTTVVIPSTDIVAYAIGDIVSSAAGADANGVPYVAKTAANGVARGVIVGFDVTGFGTAVSLAGASLALENTNIPATKTKDYYALIVEDPNVVFEIQADAVTAANLVAANMNKNADFVVGAAPSTGTGQSGTVLSSASIATTSTLPLKIRGLVQRDDNAFGAYARLLVSFNKHELLGNTAGV